MRRPIAVLLAGAVAGYVALAYGPLAAVLVLVASALGLIVLHAGSGDLGVFMLGAGLSSTAVLGRVLLYASTCDYQPCISALTLPTFALAVAIALAGLVLVVRAAATSSPST